MAARRRTKTSKKISKAYEQAMAAEGAPAALDLLGLGSTIGDLIRGKPAKRPAKKKRAAKKRKKAPAKARTSRAKKKSPARKSRRRK